MKSDDEQLLDLIVKKLETDKNYRSRFLAALEMKEEKPKYKKLGAVNKKPNIDISKLKPDDKEEDLFDDLPDLNLDDFEE